MGEKYELDVMALSRHMFPPSDCDVTYGRFNACNRDLMNFAGQSFFPAYYIFTLVGGHFQYRRVIISYEVLMVE